MSIVHSKGIIQTGIGSVFRETVGRVRQERIGQFDVLRVTLVGNVYNTDRWIPALGSPSTSAGLPYPNMILTDCSQPEEDGAMCQIQCTYTGFMGINGYVPQPLLSINETETSASIQVGASAEINRGKSVQVGIFYNGRYVATPEGSTQQFASFGESVSITPVMGNVGRVQRVGFSTITINYLSTAATSKYQTLIRPKGPHGYNQDLSAYKVISTIIGQVSGVDLTYDADGRYGGVIPYGGGPDWTQLKAPRPQLMCTNFTADQVGGTYYNCSETWEFKYIDTSHLG